MPFLLAEILDFQGSAHLIGVGSLSTLYYKRKWNVYLREKDVHTYRRTELFNLSRAGGAVRAG